VIRNTTATAELGEANEIIISPLGIGRFSHALPFNNGQLLADSFVASLWPTQAQATNHIKISPGYFHDLHICTGGVLLTE
jgi:hypothetical protein